MFFITIRVTRYTVAMGTGATYAGQVGLNDSPTLISVSKNMITTVMFRYLYCCVG